MTKGKTKRWDSDEDINMMMMMIIGWQKMWFESDEEEEESTIKVTTINSYLNHQYHMNVES